MSAAGRRNPPASAGDRGDGILADHAITALIAAGGVSAVPAVESDQIQPASLDLRLGACAWRLRASFLPNGAVIADRLTPDIVMHRMDLSAGAVLETGCVYLVPLQESLALPAAVAAAANPKSSTGRVDLFVRIIADRARSFDEIPAGYHGPLYAEISPRTFSVLAKAGERLAQIRFRRGRPAILRETNFSIGLSGIGPVGFRARHHSGVIDLGRPGAHDPREFWEPLFAQKGRLVLDPGAFYILASKEPVAIPLTEAAEMAPIRSEFGEFRAHYAGFFDPGFGLGAEARAVLEVRARDVPFMLEDGQMIGTLVFERLTATPARAYGLEGSNYHGQGLKLSKHFSGWTGER